ncbi:hypothetical protein [Nocardiopsis halotolerans]|nr:hypothetical protein [Nocardiopsis halotolerans]
MATAATNATTVMAARGWPNTAEVSAPRPTARVRQAPTRARIRARRA